MLKLHLEVKSLVKMLVHHYTIKILSIKAQTLVEFILKNLQKHFIVQVEHQLEIIINLGRIDRVQAYHNLNI